MALGSFAVGIVHAAVCPSHFREATLFGVFFAVVSVAQLSWAAALLSRPRRSVLLLGAALQLSAGSVWLLSRTVGVPFGPERWHPEAVGVLDLLTFVVELVIAAGALHLAAVGQVKVAVSRAARRAWRWLPEGGVLPDEVWAQRHRAILIVLWVHIPFLLAFGLIRRLSLEEVFFEIALLIGIALCASLTRHRRRATVITAVGLLTCSAVLVRMSGGVIEMHFHYFVMVGVITLYQDWWPFLIAIGYVVLQHGLAGIIDPAAVYNHSDAVDHPWEWAGIHGLFVLAMSSAGIASWRLNEAFLGHVTERQEQLTDAHRVAKIGSWEHDLESGRTFVSEELCRLFATELGAGFDTASFEPFLTRIHHDDFDAWQSSLEAARTMAEAPSLDFRIVLDDGTLRWFSGMTRFTSREPDRAGVLSGTVQDITERKQAEADVNDALSLLKATLDATADGILVVDMTGKITSFNHRFVEMWGIPDDLLARRDDEEAIGFVLAQLKDPEMFLAKVRDLYAHPDAQSEDVLEFLDGRIHERYSTPQRVGGVTVGRVWSFHDVTDRARLQEELAHQAFHDSLTSLANQALFRDRVEHALQRRHRQFAHLGVLFLDLDDFKTVNDSLGHPVGDQLLVAVADRLRKCLRTTDTAARLGGDEFAVLIEDADSDGAVLATADRIVLALRDPFGVEGREVFIHASIGIAFAAEEATSELLLRNADLAMYTAKRQGKDRYAIYQSDMHIAALGRLDLEADLRRGLAKGDLTVYYQPIVTMATGAIVGTEALVRWEHPVRGFLSPDSFIPIAEETGLVVELGRQVLLAACTQTRAWQREHGNDGLYVSVNLSARQLQDPDLVEDVRRCLRESGLAARSLVLEITETAMMQDTDRAIAALTELKALGLQLAVDDFGTGYSSLSYLQRFPVDLLKIDRSFVSDIDATEAEASFAHTILTLAGTLHLTAVAEGVETALQANVLQRMGCELAQGYHYARPMPAPKLRTLLQAANLPRVATTSSPIEVAVAP